MALIKFGCTSLGTLQYDTRNLALAGQLQLSSRLKLDHTGVCVTQGGRLKNTRRTMSKRTDREMALPPSGKNLTTCLDNLCDAAVEKMFRYSAHRPRRADWTDPRTAKNLCDISQPGHPLRRRAQMMVKELHLAAVDE